MDLAPSALAQPTLGWRQSAVGWPVCCGRLSSPRLHPLDVSSTLSPVVTTKNICSDRCPQLFSLPSAKA